MHVPTEDEIDAMSDDELEAYLASARHGQDGDSDGDGGQDAAAHTPGAPATGPLATGGAPRSYGLLLVVLALIGLAACWELMLAELTELRTPLADLACDINPLVSCGATLSVWQGNLLGVPNAFVGAMAMAVMVMAGALLATGTRLPRWVWWVMSAGMAGALGFVLWFAVTSVVTFGKLCPYCMVIWAVVIPMAWSTWARAAQGGHLPLGRGAARALLRHRWWLTALTYLLVYGGCVVGLWGSFVLYLS